MKTIVQKLSKRLLTLGLAFAAYSGAQAQCSTTNAITNDGSGGVTFNASLSYPTGWSSYISISFGDGDYSYGAGTVSTYTTAHQYTSNGMYFITTSMHAFDPLDSMNACTSTAYDTVIVNMPCSVNAGPVTYSQTGGVYDYTFNSTVTSPNFHDIYWSVRDAATNGWVYGTQGGQTFNYTFPAQGMYLVECFASAVDSVTMQGCYDSSFVYVAVDTGNGNPGTPQCNASFYIFQDSLNPAIWYGVNNSTVSQYATYLWNFGDGSTSTLPYPSHTYAAPGNYVICLTVTDSVNMCSHTVCDSSAAFRLSTSALMGSITIAAPTGIKENGHIVSGVKVFPNPMADLSTIAFASAVSANGKVEVTGVLGNVVLSETIAIAKGSNEIRLNTAALANGVYYVRIMTGNEVVSTIKAVK